MDIYDLLLSDGPIPLSARDIADMGIEGWGLNRIQGMCSDETDITVSVSPEEDMYWEDLMLTEGLERVAIIPLADRQWATKPERSHNFPDMDLYDYAVDTFHKRGSVSTSAWCSSGVDYEWKVFSKWASLRGYRAHHWHLPGMDPSGWMEVIGLVHKQYDEKVDESLHEEMDTYWSGDVYRYTVTDEETGFSEGCGGVVGDEHLWNVVAEEVGYALVFRREGIVNSKRQAQEA